MLSKKTGILLLAALMLILGMAFGAEAANQLPQNITYEADIILIGKVGPTLGVSQAGEGAGPIWYTDWQIEVEKYLVNTGSSGELVVSTPGAEGKPPVGGSYKLNQWGERVLLFLKHKNGVLEPMGSIAVVPLENNEVKDSRYSPEDKAFIRDFLGSAETFVPGQPEEEATEPAEKPAAEAKPAPEQPASSEQPKEEVKQEESKKAEENKDSQVESKPATQEKQAVPGKPAKQAGQNMVIYIVIGVVLLFAILIPILVLTQPKKHEHRFDKYL